MNINDHKKMITFEYQTGKLERDFKLKKENELCRVMYHTPTKIGGNICIKCKCYKGIFHDCIMCNNERQEDSENISETKRKLYEKVKNEALCALDY